MSHSEKSLDTLSGPNFAGADFRGANFSGANLSGANFAGANLAGAVFHPQDQVQQDQAQNPQEQLSNLNFQNFISVAKPNQDHHEVAQGPASLPEYPVLNCNGSQLRVISWEPRVFTIENFLTPTECDYLIELAKPQMTRSQVFDVGNGDSKVEGERTSRGCFFNVEPYCSNNVVNDIERRIAEITLIPPIYGQSFQILHYGVGQKYDPHHDYFDPAFAGSQTVIQKRGQRFGTFLIYLASPEAGGETTFPRLGLKVPCVKGNALLFYSTFPDGLIDPLSFHGSSPVEVGDKWVATKWLQEKPNVWHGA